MNNNGRVAALVGSIGEAKRMITRPTARRHPNCANSDQDNHATIKTRVPASQRRVIAMLVIILSLIASVHARAATLRLVLDKGQVLTWNWHTLRSTEIEGQPKQSGEIATPVTVRVLDRFRDAYLLEIQNGPTIFDPVALRSMTDIETAVFQKFLETLKVQFFATSDGQIKDIVNFDDVRATGRKMIEVQAQNADDRDMLLLEFEHLACSKETLRDRVLEDVGLLFYGTNVDPQIKRPVDSETDLSNLFGEGPVKARGQLSLMGIDRRTKSAQIHVEQEVDKQSFIQMAMKQFARISGKEPPKEVLESSQNGSLQNSIDATVSLDSALTTYAKRVRTTLIGNAVRIDQVEITLQN
jgi:hypothetical protein